MIYFEVTQHENMDMAIGKLIPLEQAIERLIKKNQQAHEFELIMTCHYQLIYEDHSVYESSITFYQENFNLYQTIEKDLLSMNGGTLNQDMKDFLDFLLPLFPKGTRSLLNGNDQTMEKPKKEKQELKKKKAKNLIKIANWKKISKWVFLIPLLGVVIFSIFYSIQTLSQSEKESEQSYSYLIQNKMYIEAANLYPDKTDEIENLMYEIAITTKEQEITNQLRQLSDCYATTFGVFDLAIIESDYATAIKFYETNESNFESHQDRQILAGYAYLKENQLEKAKEISERLSSVELEKKIFEYTQLSLEIEERDKQLKELEEGGSKNKEKAREIAEDKFQLMEKRVNL